MKIRYDRREYGYSLAVIFLLFYIYNTTFQETIFISRMIGVLLVLFVTTFIFFKSVNKKGHYMNDMSWAWIGMIVLSIFGNQDLANDSESRWLLPMAGILLILTLKKKIKWHKAFITTARAFVLVHAFFTIFFFVFKPLYTGFFVNFIPGNHVYLLGKFYEGCMPGITAHYSTNGIYLGFGLIFFIVDYLVNYSKNDKNKQLVILFKIFFVFFALMLTAKRAHILFATMASFFMYYVYNSNKKVTRWFYIIMVGLVGIFILVIGAQFIPVLGNVVNRFLHADGGEITNGRIWFWEFAIEQFKESPLIGIGWGGFKHEYFKVIGSYTSTSDWVDAHCVFIQLLCEQGIIGLCLFLVGTLSGLYNTWNLIKRARTKRITIDNSLVYKLVLSLGIQIFFLLYCATGNCLYDCEAFFVYALSLAMAYSISYMVKFGGGLGC